MDLNFYLHITSLPGFTSVFSSLGVLFLFLWSRSLVDYCTWKFDRTYLLKPSGPGIFFFFLKKILFLFRERGRGREREDEKHQCERETLIGCFSYMPQLRTKPAQLGICPDWESSHQPFALWDNAQPTEPHWSELDLIFSLWDNFNHVLLSWKVKLLQQYQS